MKQLSLLLLIIPCAAGAIDHSKLDFGRPLRIDDAHPLALGEMALEFGASVGVKRGDAIAYGFEAAFLYGFAPDTHLEVAIEPTFDRRWDVGSARVGVFHALTRETTSGPATAIRVDAHLPTGRLARSTEIGIRAILGGQLGDYGKWHLNADGMVVLNPAAEDRSVRFAGALGYSSPLGLPRDYTQTVVAALRIEQSSISAEGVTGTIGIGLRKQVGIREVLDIGVESDFFATRGAPKTTLRLIAGISSSF